MSVPVLYALTGLALFGIGFYSMVVHAHPLRKILAVNVMSSGVFLVFVALAYRAPDRPPDPVPHTMVLTGVVVAVSATAVGLSLVRRIYHDVDGANTSRKAAEAQA